MNRHPSAAFVALLLLVGSAAIAQDKIRPPTADELLKLSQAGLTPDELNSVLDKNGEPVLSGAEIQRLAEAGAPEALVLRLKGAAEKASPKKLTVADVQNLVATGVPDDEIIRLIDRAENTLALSTEQLLALVQHGATPVVIKALRAKAAAVESRPSAPDRPQAVTLDDLPRMIERGMTVAQVLRRIEDSDSAFDVSVDRLVTLSRHGVPKEILKAVWARRRPGAATEGAAKAPAGEAATTAAAESRPLAAAPATELHREAEGGFSLLRPVAFRLHRETRNSNSLLTFVLGGDDAGQGAADAEISVFRYRAATPDRLVESNLGPIADNFLARLQASFAGRKITATFGAKDPRKLSGKPALRVKAATSGADGSVHQGEVYVTYGGDQIFVISTSVRSDLVQDWSERLGRCVRSFALAEKKMRPEAGGDDETRATALAAAWRDAVATRDFPLYETLFGAPGKLQERCERFVELCDGLADPSRRLVIGSVRAGPDGAETEFKLVGSGEPRARTVKWLRSGASFVLQE